MSSFFRSSSSPSPAPSVKSARKKTILQAPNLKKPASRPAKPEGDQLKAYDAILGHFSDAKLELPVQAKGSDERKPLSKAERMWLTEECFLRYLRAQKWDLATAIIKLEASITWRRENGLADDDGGERPPEEGGGLNAALVKEEGRCGKDYVNGWDEEGRPLHYQVPARNESSDSALNIKYCVWVMERSVDLMPPGVEKQVLLVSFEGGMKPPPLATVQGWISMLSHHYPERMGKAIAIKVPWILNAFFKIILPWIDPVTRAKLSFNEPAPWVPDEQLETIFGGTSDFVYDQEEYLPSLMKLCAERRRMYRERWAKLGSKMGESEWLLKGGTGIEEALAAAAAVVETPTSGPAAVAGPVAVPNEEDEKLAAAAEKMGLSDEKNEESIVVPGAVAPQTMAA